MVIGIFGESCTGKSTLAEKIAASFPCEIYTGKDYLRLAKNESIAKGMFQKKLEAAVSGGNIIYVIAEKEHLALLPEGALLRRDRGDALFITDAPRREPEAHIVCIFLIIPLFSDLA